MFSPPWMVHHKAAHHKGVGYEGRVVRPSPPIAVAAAVAALVAMVLLGRLPAHSLVDHKRPGYRLGHLDLAGDAGLAGYAF